MVDSHKITVCPLCHAPAVCYEISDGNGGAITEYQFDLSIWLNNLYGYNSSFVIENGSESPNTYGGG